MRYRTLIHFKNDEEVWGEPRDTLGAALEDLKTFSLEEDFDVEDVQFFQVEPV